MTGYTLAYIFPIYVNFFNETMDTRRATTLGVITGPQKEIELEHEAGEETVEVVEDY
jgi:hypothetical protein